MTLDRFITFLETDSDLSGYETVSVDDQGRATVTYKMSQGQNATVQIVGADHRVIDVDGLPNYKGPLF